MSEAPSWSAIRHADKQPALRARARALAGVRDFMRRAGLIEADPGALVRTPGAEVHIDAFLTQDGTYLHTSPEFAMKRLVAAGESALYFLGKVYRRGEEGPLHASEFTMLEWYRAQTSWTAVARDALGVLQAAAEAVGAEALSRNGRTCDPWREADWITVNDAFARHAGVSLLHTMSVDGRVDRDSLAGEARRIGVRVGADDDWSDLFARILVERVEPRLGWGAPCVLFDYPIAEAALARRAGHDARIAERFELYACGVELANGYGELTDALEQRRRLEAAMDEKERRYRTRWPLDEDFLAAVAQLPPCAGCALGFDRLAMLAVGAPRVADVMWGGV